MKHETANDRRDESALARFSARTRGTIQALLNSPLADQAIAHVEGEALTARRALLQELDVLDKAQPTAMSKVTADAVRAMRSFEKAESAFIEARDAKKLAAAIATGAELSYLGQHKRITTELMQSADSRLADFKHHAQQIVDNDLVAALRFWVDPYATARERRTVQRDNLAAVQSARAALRAAIDRVANWRLAAMGYAEASQALMQLCRDLAPVLAAVELNPPTVSAEHAEVGAPISWHGTSQWVVDAIAAPTKDSRQADSERLAATVARNEL